MIGLGRGALRVAGQRRWNPMGRLSVRRKLMAIAVAAVVFVVAVAVSALIALSRLDGLDRAVARVADAKSLHQDGDMMHDAIHADVAVALLAARGEGGYAPERVRGLFAADAAQFRADLAAARSIRLNESSTRAIEGIRGPLEAYLSSAKRLIILAERDRAAALRILPAFEAQFERLKVAQEMVTSALTRDEEMVRASAGAERGSARRQVLLSGIGAILGLFVLAFALARSIVRSIRGVAKVTHRISAGELDARIDDAGTDEIADLGRGVNAMADSLTAVVGRLEADAERDGFGAQLVEALEMVDDESAVLQVIERAMGVIDADAPMELLLADSSRAHLERAAVGAAGEPGCGVDSPFSCVAVRRGNPVVFESSEALNACPMLRGRRGGACSAVCVPVTFMGRALGVLHTSAPDGRPPGTAQVAQLTTLATQLGGRIGTVRAFRTTQLQASTDPLTGLMNRRTLENELGPIVRSGELVAVAIGDVDHFKKLNDTYGHESGDRALRILGDALQASVRGGDLVCRYGGEEFVMAFPGLSARDAAEVLERIRTTIAMNLQGREVPAFTISFGVTDSTRSTTLDELLRIADGGLYQAKAAGRDRVVIAGLAPGVHSSEPLPDEVDELPDADLDLVASGAGA